MRALGTWFILFGLSVLDAGVIPWLIPASWFAGEPVKPELALMGLVYVALFTGRHTGAVFGVAIGFLQDVVFGGSMLGPHAFTYGLIGYTAGFYTRRPAALGAVLAVSFAASLAASLCLDEIYRLFNIIRVPFEWNLLHDALPVALLNVFVSLAFFVPAKLYFDRYLKAPPAADDRED